MMDEEHEQQQPVPVPVAAEAAVEKDNKKTAKRNNKVCVFCGSSPGVERGMDLVYGGGSVGLMGLVSRAVHDGGGHVLGVVPKAVLPLELIGETPGELKPVAGMHQRKADAFIALPGGYGIHTKPVGLLNVDGYYDPLLAFVDKAVQEGFVTPLERTIIVHANTNSSTSSSSTTNITTPTPSYIHPSITNPTTPTSSYILTCIHPKNYCVPAAYTRLVIACLILATSSLQQHQSLRVPQPIAFLLSNPSIGIMTASARTGPHQLQLLIPRIHDRLHVYYYGLVYFN